MNQRSTQLKTPREALVWASSLLSKNGLNPTTAQWMLMALLGQDKNRFWTQLDEPLPADQAQVFQGQMERVLAGEPYQYVLGQAEFYGRPFMVNRAVLIPRPETERLVEEVLQAIQPLLGQKSLHIVDVGTGSGAIAITLALELGAGQAHSHTAPRFQPIRKGPDYQGPDIQGPDAKVFAVDISTQALTVARHNAEQLGAQVTFLHGDLLKPLVETEQQMDVIVSNPPYIALSERDQVEDSVLRHEPHLALFAGEDGLIFYRQIVKQAEAVLKRPGWLAFEVGAYQAEAVRNIITQVFPQAACRLVRDWQGYQRVVVAKID